MRPGRPPGHRRPPTLKGRQVVRLRVEAVTWLARNVPEPLREWPPPEVLRSGAMTKPAKILTASLAALGLAAASVGVMGASAPTERPDEPPAVSASVGVTAPGLEVDASGRFTTPVPPGIDPAHWRPAARPTMAPPAPPLTPSTAPIDGRKTVEDCYPPGTSGYEDGLCRNPGYYQGQFGGVHWGDEPHYATGVRFVWVMDALWDSGARQHLNAWINERNATYQEPYDLYIVLYQAEELNRPRGSCTLLGAVAQWVEVCPTTNTRSSANFAWSGDHLHDASVRISTTNSRAGTDLYKHNAIRHEMGHAVGFAHDTDCGSVMTYCSTYSTNYLGYGTNQVSVVNLVYKNHLN